MKKEDFEKWALNKYPKEFTVKNGVLTWFNFPFWKLNADTTRAVIKEFKENTNRTRTGLQF